MIHTKRFESGSVIDLTQMPDSYSTTTKKPSIVDSFWNWFKNWFIKLFNW